MAMPWRGGSCLNRDAMTLHPILIDIDPQARTIRHIGAAARAADRMRRHVVAEAGIGQRQAPGERRE